MLKQLSSWYQEVKPCLCNTTGASTIFLNFFGVVAWRHAGQLLARPFNVESSTAEIQDTFGADSDNDAVGKQVPPDNTTLAL